jgi:hypothetical protein
MGSSRYPKSSLGTTLAQQSGSTIIKYNNIDKINKRHNFKIFTSSLENDCKQDQTANLENAYQ